MLGEGNGNRLCRHIESAAIIIGWASQIGGVSCRSRRCYRPRAVFELQTVGVQSGGHRKKHRGGRQEAAVCTHDEYSHHVLAWEVKCDTHRLGTLSHDILVHGHTPKCDTNCPVRWLRPRSHHSRHTLQIINTGARQPFLLPLRTDLPIQGEAAPAEG